MAKIIFIVGKEEKEAQSKEGESLLDIATRVGIKINAQCGGKGICGKCTVRIDGRMVLACTTFPENDVTAYVPETQGKILGAQKKSPEKIDPIGKGIGLAVDIGTTTVVAALVDMDKGAVIDSASDYNRQINLGADVLSRMLHAKKVGGLDKLRDLVVATINDLISALLDKNSQVSKDDIRTAVITGNTIMTYLFFGKDPSSIRTEAVVETSFDEVSGKQSMLGISDDARVICFDAISGYVGGDIVADIICTGLDSEEKNTLLIDVGTNGEVVLGNREWMMCASSSAGPSFEGGEVKCGMRATGGAIDSVRVKSETEVTYTTIDGGEALGICGTGLIDLIAELFDKGMIDRSGNFDAAKLKVNNLHLGQGYDSQDPRFYLTKDVFISERDIKNIIRSKAAIFASQAILLENSNLKFDDVDRLVIAGGFGNFLDIDHTIRIGMFPNITRDKVVFAGNTAISGAVFLLLDKANLERMKRISKSATYIDLNSDTGFMKQYTAAMFLPHTDTDMFDVKNQ